MNLWTLNSGKAIVLASLFLLTVVKPGLVFGQGTLGLLKIPERLVQLCLEQVTPKPNEQPGCTGAEKWLAVRQRFLESVCVASSDLADKKKWVNDLLWIQRQADLLQLNSLVVAMEDICGGVLDESRSGIEIEPVNEALKVGDTVQLKATIYCPAPKVCTGELDWGTDNAYVATVDGSGLVTARKGGLARIFVASVDLPHLFAASIDLTVNAGAVDIALVIQSDERTVWDYIGLEPWVCPEDECVGWARDTWRDGQGFWGICGDPGDVVTGSVKIDGPGVIGVSLTEDGPFVQGPLQIPYTLKYGCEAWSDRLYFKALGQGTAKIRWAVSTLWHEYELTVGTAYEIPPYVTGLRQIGTEVATELGARFDDFRFAATAFGWHPELAMSCEEGMADGFHYPEWKPYWETAKYVDFLDFTSDFGLIAGALSEVRLICDEALPLTPYDGRSVYSAVKHAIEDFAWREGAFRAVIVFSVRPACYEHWWGPGDCDSGAEQISGLTSQNLIDAATQNGVSLFMVNAGPGSYGDAMREPFQQMAQQSGGWYTEDSSDYWPLLNALEKAIEQVAIRVGY